MISVESKIKVVDNSGAKLAKCIKILALGVKKFGYIGDLLLVSIKKKSHTKKIKKKVIYYGLIVMVNRHISRKDGTYVKFNENRILLFSNTHKFLGTRIYGPIMKELKFQIYNDSTKKQKYLKLISYSNSII